MPVSVVEGLALGDSVVVVVGLTVDVGDGLAVDVGGTVGVGLRDGEGSGTGGAVCAPGFLDAQMMMWEISLSLPRPPGSKMPFAFTSGHTTEPGAGLANTVLGCSVESLGSTLPAFTMTLL